MVKALLRQVCPPILWNLASILKKKKTKMRATSESPAKRASSNHNPREQDLTMYWNNDYAKVLEEWGMDSTWNEIQLVLSNCKGKVLDIACGTGITIKLLDKFTNIELYGFDISDLLIQKAIEKGILPSRLKVEDATKTTYLDNEFDYSYSIGSLEHFTSDGIDCFLEESARYTRVASFHMIPVSRNGEDQGWLKTIQSFFNNSEQWWLAKFTTHFPVVYSIPSKWQDEISYGRWFICFK